MFASKTCRHEATLFMDRSNVHFFQKLSEVRMSDLPTDNKSGPGLAIGYFLPLFDQINNRVGCP